MAFFNQQSIFYRHWLWRLELDLQFGVLSTCWKDMETTTPAPMLMYGKEASNRKQ